MHTRTQTHQCVELLFSLKSKGLVNWFARLEEIIDIHTHGRARRSGPRARSEK
jgi:hypothetical protein